MDATLANLHANLSKEVRYRCSYRGTLELDTVCRSLLPHLETMTVDELTALRDLLLEPENKLMDWLVDGAHKGGVPPAFAATVAQVRALFAQRPW
jgi:succinate dehydrogenase flavin-adding protein (antitoxin of CptAB toxin-antitoxin module)